MTLTATKEEFAYLKVQCGDLDHLSGDFDRWITAYREKLANTFGMIQPFLPEKCDVSLDIGSGLGGINILICEFYEKILGRAPKIHILDGDGAPRSVKHDQPFNDMALSAQFLHRHGVKQVLCLTKHRLDIVGPYSLKYDLIMSFAAWGFHIPVKSYLDFVLDHSHEDTVVIVDARRPRAVVEFMEHFRVVASWQGKKYNRFVMRNINKGELQCPSH